MSECVREATPVEVLERELIDILSQNLKEESRKNMIEDAIEKAKSYEEHYYNNRYVVISNQLKDAQKENKSLMFQNRIIAEYAMFLEA